MSSESNKIIENLKEAYDALEDAIGKNKLTKRDFERIKFEINWFSSLVDDGKFESYELRLYKDALKGILQSYNNVLYDVMVGIICNINKKYEFDDEIILEWKNNLARYLELNHLLNGFKDYGFYPSGDTSGKFNKRVNINLVKNTLMHAFENLYTNKLLESKEIFKNGYNLENLIEDIRSSESYKNAITWDDNMDLNDNIMKNALSRIQ